ncbi:prephenate dehydrogenase [Calidifontibacter sp. DB0510]|uniref:Prephenate dehydrogenase n=1 Tax=Metallococcus carri TaxID=1656884 RepID=A0A967EHL8_9MICO|nr:prephenate dehydrogenase [Metallococcus carri]NHN56568.1 prephenate dehydrogenase [Metallococcus carri]NOP38867.1 prephenate dehydrogenase [Calidifontibacter sp. DB2511S]
MTGGLRFTSVEDWQRWTGGHRRAERALRAARGRLKPRVPQVAKLLLPQGDPTILVVLDKLTSSHRAAVHAPLAHLDLARTAVLTVDDPELDGAWTEQTWTGPQQLPTSIRGVLSLGSFLALSGSVKPWATARDIPFVVAQHGLLTPWSPPAADGDLVLAWTEADAGYWTAGRPSVTATVVGSELLWRTTQLPPATAKGDRLLMLGQLHGEELPRSQTLRTYWEFCRREDADYRPHPNEADVVSRALHRAMRAGGITFEQSGRDLAELGRPVVSIFSTGTVEAAQRGLPAWVTHPDPPGWVRDFWDRYGLSRWGSDPTPAWPMPEQAPAATVARILETV